MTTEPAEQSTGPPRAPVLERGAAMTSAATEYRRAVVLLESVTPGQWVLPTDCPGWDVQIGRAHV